jgi:hypothetical protein
MRCKALGMPMALARKRRRRDMFVMTRGMLVCVRGASRGANLGQSEAVGQ